eukprot:scpid19820/ scgid5183/ DENN domain-containing protein 5B; Rab6IP1-like protein
MSRAKSAWATVDAPLVYYFSTCGLDGSREFTPVNPRSGTHKPDDQLTPLQCHYEAGSLCHFPETRDSLPYDGCAISRLAMPIGVKFYTKASLPAHPSSHCFLMTQEDGRQLYGTAIKFYHIVKDPALLQAVKSMQDIWGFTNEVNTSSVESGAWWQVDEDLYISKSIVLLLNGSYPHFGMDFLTQMLVASQQTNGTRLVESHIHHLLDLKQVQPGYAVTLQGPIAPMHCIRSHESGIPLLNFHLQRVMSIFSLADLLSIVALLLLENQLLLVSEDLSSLTEVSECLGALINPFEWQHVLAPILPGQQMDLLDAPVPFIMGLLMSADVATRSDLDLPDDVTLINIDTGTIDVPKQKAVSLPENRALHMWLSKAMQDCPLSAPGSPGGSRRPRWKEPRAYMTSGLISPVCDNTELFDNRMTVQFYATAMPTPQVTCEILHEFGVISVNQGISTKEQRILEERCGSESSNNSDPGDSSDGVVVAISVNAVGLQDQGLRPDIKVHMIEAQYEHENELKFNVQVQACFFKYFQTILRDYQIYMVDCEQAELSNDVTFDTVAFLSDQAASDHSFFSQFANTQTFSVFTEMKALEKFAPLPPYRAYFDECLNANQRSRTRNNTGSVSLSLRKVVSQLISSNNQRPSVESSPMQRLSLGNSRGVTSTVSEPTHSQESSPTPVQRDHLMLKRDSVLAFMQTSKSVLNASSGAGHGQSRAKSSTGPMSHEVVTRRILQETKSKVRRLVLAKMGREGFMLSIGFNDCQSVMSQEEQTGIISLCDMLERVWTHGVKQKKHGQRSALWISLCHYMKKHGHSPADPGLSLIRAKIPAKHLMSDTSGASSSGMRHFSYNSRKSVTGTPKSGATVMRSSSMISSKRIQQKLLEQEASPGELAVRAFCVGRRRSFHVQLIDDIRRVMRMPEIKSDNGCARAFIRLALEKKMLASYLEKLVDDMVYLVETYRDYAFLRQEDMAEQLIGHLLILTTVNLSSFSNCYHSATMVYTVVVIPKQGLSPALQMRLFGSNGEVNMFEIPASTSYFQVQNTNIGCVEAALVSSVDKLPVVTRIVDMFVLCDRTEVCFRFDVRRWAAVEDSSSSMVFCAHEVSGDVLSNAIHCDRSPSESMIGSSSRTSVAGSPQEDDEVKGNGLSMHVSAVENIAESINLLAKYVDGMQTETQHSLVQLIWGQQGLCSRLVEALSYGLKAKRMLRADRCLWDYFDLVRACTLSAKGQNQQAWHNFCATFKLIDECETFGKHVKSQILICEGLRLNALQAWLEIFHKSPVMCKMYVNNAPLRSMEVCQDLMRLMQWCSGITLVIPLPVETLIEDSIRP